MQQIINDWNKMVTGRLYNPSDKNVAKQHKKGKNLNELPVSARKK